MLQNKTATRSAKPVRNNLPATARVMSIHGECISKISTTWAHRMFKPQEKQPEPTTPKPILPTLSGESSLCKQGAHLTWIPIGVAHKSQKGQEQDQDQDHRHGIPFPTTFTRGASGVVVLIPRPQTQNPY